jgi:hypothetical protein
MLVTQFDGLLRPSVRPLWSSIRKAVARHIEPSPNGQARRSRRPPVLGALLPVEDWSRAKVMVAQVIAGGAEKGEHIWRNGMAMPPVPPRSLPAQVMHC